MNNAQNFVLDNAEISFSNYDEMRAFVEEREKNTEWLEQGVREIVFGALHDEPLCAPVYAEKMHVSTEAVEDTMAGAGLKLTVSSGTRPVGASAVSSIINRAGLQAAGWKKLRNGNLESLKSVLNMLMDVSSGAVHIKVADEKIRAVHSGKYTPIRADRLLDIVKGYFDKEWPNTTFEEGYFCHERMQEVIDLSQYKDDFFGRIPTGIFQTATPAFVVYSSDVATSAVTLVPSMKLGGVCVPMTKAVKIEHMGEDLETRVADALEMILAYFQGAVADMQALDKVVVNHGTNALKRLLKDGGMPKKCAWEAIEAFEAMYGSNPVTATEIYLAAVDAYSAVLREFPQDKCKILMAADCVARVANARWTDVDKPGEVKF
ncbi:MAG TPA: hypothetical protein DCL51_09700 [Ruthenibacterium lactatiformans]|nr:hypothetical protein [Ruthenibacterium lactatiformans]